MQRASAAGSTWLKRWSPRGLAGAAFWLAVWFGLLFALRMLPGALGTFFSIIQLFVGVAVTIVAIPLLLRFVRRRLLWSLRNKLVVTYLLIGLAPVVLFVTLVLISTYVAAGQFSIHLVDSRVQEELGRLSGDNAHRTELIARHAEGGLLLRNPQADWTVGLDSASLRVHRDTLAYVNGAPLDLGRPHGKTPLGLPPWAAELKEAHFQGLVLDGSDLYLAAIHQLRLHDGRLLSVVSSMPVDGTLVDVFSKGLGRAQLFIERLGPSQTTAASKSAEQDAKEKARRSSRRNIPAAHETSIAGGIEPPNVNLADIQVHFLSSLSMIDWDTGEQDSVPIKVDSRPSLLYQQLFGASLGGIITDVYRIGLIVLCVLFAAIELLALIMAIRLSRTMTASVADLYAATQKIDRGELDHRIGVQRNDQLAELSRSFNKMTGSLQRLLEEQKEKERLQNELSIAQEVQANLFPQRVSSLERLELHGVCRPARSVSGDYYDFLVFHEEAHNGSPRRETGLGIAIGDISGKGISAALLMATLHSAVRAYRFASEELVYSQSLVAGLIGSRDINGKDCDELFQSPGRILSLLNRHLYRSTQPEKYATLFLAHYNADTSMLTYSNAGQLPPLVLGRDGAVRRLDHGGTVVGLFDGMHYDEGTLHMTSGDILVAYSDGVTEPENDFGEFGEERLMEVVRRYRDQPLHVISGQVMQALDAWIGAEEQPDDITLVLARQV
jgi:sigma-B regulation protein RsbU (phosphoserine phosphatase)